MLLDCQGNAVSGATVESLAAYESAVHVFNIYRGDPVEFVDQAIAASPHFAMAHVLKAYLYFMATEPEATDEAKRIVEALKTISCDDRVTSHMAVLTALAANNWTDAGTRMDIHNMHFPLDLVGLQVGVLIDFFRANSRNMRDRILRVLPKWGHDVPGRSIVLGLLSFGLEETGNYAEAEDVGRTALDQQPLDCWAHHAVAHVMEMQGRAEDGVGWMMTRQAHWAGEDNFFQVHNWWHRAIFHMDLEDFDQALDLYDDEIRRGNSVVAVDMVDASALLWRLQVSGHEVGGRWQELSDSWMQHANGKLYPFNDWHAVMAHLGAGREARVEDVLASYANLAGDGSEVAAWQQKIAQPLIEGFGAFHAGNFAMAVEKLHPARFIANSFGGSHAQRDVIDWTLMEAALRGGLKDVAESLANERVAHKPHSPLSRSSLERSQILAVENMKAA